MFCGCLVNKQISYEKRQTIANGHKKSNDFEDVVAILVTVMMCYSYYLTFLYRWSYQDNVYLFSSVWRIQ